MPITRKTCLRVFAIWLITALAAPASAHDFFLLPANFHAEAAVDVQATVGAAFPIAETVVNEDRIAELRSTPGSSLTITGPEERFLRLNLTVTDRGAHVAAVRLRPRDVEYAEDRIPLIMEEYEVGPEARAAVAALPSPRILQATSQRFAKSIVCFETCAGSRAEQAFGYPLEFVADASEPNRFVLLSNGAPLANYPVAIATSAGRTQLATDESGSVSLDSAVQGPFMLFAAVMTPPERADQRFQMLLTSLTTQRH